MVAVAHTSVMSSIAVCWHSRLKKASMSHPAAQYWCISGQSTVGTSAPSTGCTTDISPARFRHIDESNSMQRSHRAKRISDGIEIYSVHRCILCPSARDALLADPGIQGPVSRDRNMRTVDHAALLGVDVKVILTPPCIFYMDNH